jgi:hypothetical protein
MVAGFYCCYYCDLRLLAGFGHAHGEAAYIDDGRRPVFEKASPGDLDIIFEHDSLFLGNYSW